MSESYAVDSDVHCEPSRQTKNRDFRLSERHGKAEARE
ncbi:hypothetical protein OROHE_027267 [Orobanche hederae]